MNFKKALIIPVFVYTDQELELVKLSLNEDDVEMGFDETEDRAFWSIESAHPYRDNKKYTGFYSSGESYYTPIPLDEFVVLVNNHN